MHKCNKAAALLTGRVQPVVAFAQSEDGVFSPRMSKGHRADICACPDGGSLVLTSLNQLNLN